MTFVFDVTSSSTVRVAEVPRSGAVDPVPFTTAANSEDGRRQSEPLSPDLLQRMQRYWQAANYLTIGQIYLKENALLQEPLLAGHIKPRLLGHWGTSPGLSFIYVHLNRLINEQDANIIYLAGPGHGGPAIVANVYLEGTYSEVYPHISRDVAGLRQLFRQFSTPGGIPSHVSVPTPGSMVTASEFCTAQRNVTASDQ